MNFLSVSSGIEAASVAWKPLGWRAVAFSEIAPFPCALLKHRYPTVPNWGDMTNYEVWPDAIVDLLCGGTPCQSFSVAGLRKGLDDPRGNLMLTYGAIAAKYRPRWLVWENVPGVLSSNDGRDFGAFLWLLGQLGYGFAYRVLDAQYIGVPQRRRRVFVVGYLGDWRRAAAVLFERHSLQGHPAPSRQARQGIAGTLGTSSSSGRSYGSSPISDNLIAQALPFDTTQMTSALNRSHPKAGDPCHPLAAGAHPPAIAFDCKSSGQNGFGVGYDLAGTQRAMGHADSHSNGGGHQAVAYTTKLHNTASNNAGKVFEERSTCLDANSPPPALLTATQVRRMTPRECERLQGFEDDYTLIPFGRVVRAEKLAEDWIKYLMRGGRLSREECFGAAADGPRYKALGNSWAVPCARWIGRRIQQVESLELLAAA